MAGQTSIPQLARFCAELRSLQRGSGKDVSALAHTLSYSRSQLYDLLAGRIKRPPKWESVVEPLVRFCVDGEPEAIERWRNRYLEMIAGVELAAVADVADAGEPAGPEDWTGRPTPVPAQLPADLRTFSGRSEQLATLDGYLAEHRDTPTVIAVTGMAGVGKTTLALRWAWRNRDAFPDGQLYVDLRGFDADEPRSDEAVLAEFLWSLGLRGPDIPPTVEQRAAAFRSLLAGGRRLIVLDNAANARHLRNLLPGAGSSVVLVTSRDSLAGLVVRQQALRLELDPLDAIEASSLMHARVEHLPGHDHAAVERLVALCAGLPLALSIVAESAITKRHLPLDVLADTLADERQRLRALNAGGDERTSIQDVFSWSYRHLGEDARRAFRLLGVWQAIPLDTDAAAALLDLPREHAAALLDELERAHLVRQVELDAFTMHDLLRTYAAAQTAAQADEHRLALDRLLGHYVDNATAVMATLYPHDRLPTGRARIVDAVRSPDTALAWLDDARDAITATVRHLARHGQSARASDLLVVITRYFQLGRAPMDLLRLSREVVDAVRTDRNPQAEARTLIPLGVSYSLNLRYEHAEEVFQQAYELGDLTDQSDVLAASALHLGIIRLRREDRDTATAHFERAVTLYRTLADRSAEARALGYLAFALQKSDRLDEAVLRFEEAVAIAEEIGDRSVQARVLNMLASVYHRQQRFDRTVATLRLADSLANASGDLTTATMAQQNLGVVLTESRPDEALRVLRRGLAMSRTANDRVLEARVLHDIARLHHRDGDRETAMDYVDRSRALSMQLGHRLGEARARNLLGELHNSANDSAAAASEHEKALAAATELADEFEQARAHYGIGLAASHTGDTVTADRELRTARSMFAALNEPITGEIDALLVGAP